MLLFILRRLIGLVLTLLAAAAVVFVVLEILPGDPARAILGIDATDEALVALRRQLGLERPAIERFFAWVFGFARGDLGQSYAYGVPVSELIGDRLQVTVPLALFAISLSASIGITLGLTAAANHERLGDTGVMIFSQFGVAIPNFWFGILLVLLFSVTLGWLPAGGFPGWEDPARALRALFLPALSLALPQSAILARVTRSATLDALGEDWVRTARAKGLTRRAVLWRHVLRNAMVPVATIMGLQFSFLLAGAIIIENVFNMPGLGRLVFQAIAQRDLIVVKDVIVILAGLVVTINFAVDLLYGVLDPRLRRR